MREKLEALVKRLKDEQRALIHALALSEAAPSQSSLQRIAQLEMNIAAVENTLDEYAD
ncbi:MAG: hypothetical protein ABTQ31_07280 [Rhizobiaceae bacterium]|jgi:uncharacterized coiled-coil protein SlyX